MTKRTCRLLAAAVVAAIVAGGAQARVGEPSASRASRVWQADLRLRAASVQTAKLDATLARLSAAQRARRVEVVVHPERGEIAAAKRAVERARGRIEFTAGGLLQALLSSRALRALSRDRAIVRLTAPVRPVDLDAGDEGVPGTNAPAWQAAGLAGAGVKVAIIDAGFARLGQAQAAGKVNPSAVSVDDCGGHFGDDPHGTAVAEIVTAEAPAAQLYLICVDTEVALAAAEKYAETNGVRIISMSLGWYGTWSGDGRGPAGTPDATVAAARAAGILWVNAAGNDGVAHWRGTFTDTNGDGFSELGPLPMGDETDSFTLPPADGVCIFMRWAEWPHATNDYDLELLREPSGMVLAGSGADQHRLHGDPTESLCYINPQAGPMPVAFAIAAPYGSTSPPPVIDVFAEARPFSVRLEYSTAVGSISDPAASPSALAVGAVCWQTNDAESYSSQGPTVDGRLKPDLVAPDSVSSPIYGSFSICGQSGFAGTSASAPHVAGAAALVAQRFPNFGPDRLQSYLVQHATDLGVAGADDVYGAGRLVLPPLEAPELASTTIASVQARSARVTATASPFESATAVKLEYGTTTAYGMTLAASVSAAPDGHANATAVLRNLRPATTYHVRAAVSGFGGTVTGPDRVFRTARVRH